MYDMKRMSDDRDDSTAVHRIRLVGCRTQSEHAKRNVKAASDKRRLTLVTPVMDKKSGRLSPEDDTELRDIIDSLRKRQAEDTRDDDLPPAA